MTVMEDKPWKKFTVKEIGLLHRFLPGIDFGYIFQWTDLTDLYQEELTCEEITRRWISLNKAVETEVDGQIEAIESGLKSPLSVQASGGKIDINFMDSELEVPLKWHFDCHKVSSDTFSRQIVQPSLKVMKFQIDLNAELIKIIKAKDAELELLYDNGPTSIRPGMKTQPFNFEETQKNCNFDQSDLTDYLIHERFNQALKQCKIRSPSRKVADKTCQKVDDKPKESKTNIPIVRKKIEMEIPTQVSTQRKRPISQVTVAPTKKLSKHTLEKLKKF